MQGTLMIRELSWERVLLHLDVDRSPTDDVEYYLQCEDRPEEALPVSATPLSDSVTRLSLNVTAANGRRAVPNGTYRLFARSSETKVGRFPLDRVPELSDPSRAFVYNSNRSAYTVTFGIDDDEDHPDLLIRFYSFGRKNKSTAPYLTRKLRKATKQLSKAKRAALREIRRVARVTRKKNQPSILFASEARLSMQGNLLAVHDRMCERTLDRNYTFAYSFRTEGTSSRFNALKLAWKMGRADIVLIDDYFSILMDLADLDNQKVIQLWHAGSGFKSIGYSRFGQYGSPHLTNSHRLYTYAICGSQHLRDVYSEAFGIEREAVIATGLPRVDAFLRDGRADEVLPTFEAAYPGAAGKRRMLFAPTFRGRGSRDAHYNYETIDFAVLHEACGEDTVILFRQHHFLHEPAPIPPQYADRLIDVAAFPDTNDLLLISDVLITDYSSIVYEYSLLKRPMIFYAYDLDAYTATRGMHRNFHDVAPGPVATDFGELVQLIRDPGPYIGKTEAFVAENFDYVDTQNSDRVIDWLILQKSPSTEGGSDL
ncbi:MAG: CDP-glycerol glycerophosphotransferase family protein [Propioniciclava sp.]